MPKPVSPQDGEPSPKPNKTPGSNRYLQALFVACIVGGIIYGNTQFAELPAWKSTLGGTMFGGFLGLCVVNYTRLNF